MEPHFPPDKEQQPWEKFRHEVEDQQKAKDRHAVFDRRVSDLNYERIEARLRAVEVRQQNNELEVIRRIEALAAGWVVAERELREIRLIVVSRAEFDTVRILSVFTFLGLCGWVAYKLTVVG